jgi:ATP-dependent HslUV protease ATP-binding subunit HslU
MEQYKALIATEKVTLEIAPEAIRELARIAAQVNESVENIGARRLQTVMEKLIEDLSFEAEDRKGETVTIDADYVRERLADLAQDADLSKYVL